MPTALITGGAGFIGSNLADALIATGVRCHVVDDLSTGREVQVPAEAEFHHLDIREAARLAEVVGRVKPDVIHHLAAQVDVRKAIENPQYDAEVNINGTISVLEAARGVGARVVFASTGGAGYGEYEGLPVPTDESNDVRPMAHYGQSKMSAEGYLGLYSRLYGLPTVVLRLCNVYGPRQDPHGEAGVVAIFCGKLLDGERPKVFGDGLQTRDYGYVGDIARAFMAAAEGPAGETANIGTGVETTVLDLLDGLGYAGAPEYAPARAGELQRSALDPTHAERVWGWRAEMPLAEGLGLTYRSVEAGRAAPRDRTPGFVALASD